MSAQNLASTDTNLPEWLDPFPEPRTLPHGWDLEGIVLTPTLPVVEGAEAPTEATPG